MYKSNTTLAGFVLGMLLLIGCKQSPATLDAPKSTSEARAKLVGKAWKIKDIGLKMGMFAFSDSEESKNTPIADWISSSEEMGKFEKENLEEHRDFALKLNADGTMTSVNKALGLVGKQSFQIKESQEEEEDKASIKLEISADSSTVMQMSGVSFSYPILGLDDKTVILQTTNQINRRNVLLMLTSE